MSQILSSTSCLHCPTVYTTTAGHDFAFVGTDAPRASFRLSDTPGVYTTAVQIPPSVHRRSVLFCERGDGQLVLYARCMGTVDGPSEADGEWSQCLASASSLPGLRFSA